MKKKVESDQIERTYHGDNIANEIDEDAYGDSGTLNEADVFAILDAIHSNVMDKNPALSHLLSVFMDKIVKTYDIEMY